MQLERIKKQIARNFSKANSTYDKNALVQKKVARELINFVRLKPHASVLDVGCGTGFCIEEVENHITPSQLVGIDIASGMIDACKNKWRNHTFICADAETFNTTEQFELIISNFTAQWFGDIPALIKKYLAHNLAPNGHIIISLPVAESFKELRAIETFSRTMHELPSAEMLTKSIGEIKNISLQHKRLALTQQYKDPIAAIRAIKKIGAHYSAGTKIPTSALRKLKSPCTNEPFVLTYDVLMLDITSRQSE